MQRDNIVVEVQRRLNSIKTINGYDLTVRYVFRNPESEPSPELMPMSNIFEFPSITIDSKLRRGAKEKPIYLKEFRLVMEHWYLSESRGDTSRDIMKYLKAARIAIFEDGQTLGGLASLVVEEEESRVYRPPVDPKAVGIGHVLCFNFTEDFNTL